MRQRLTFFIYICKSLCNVVFTEKKKIFCLFVCLLLLIFSFGCSLKRTISIQMEPLVNEVEKSILTESHEPISEYSLPFAIKFAEGFYGYYPKSKYFSSKLALLYGAYNLAYVDDGPYSDFEDNVEEKQRASKTLYKKSFDFGLKSLDLRLKGFASDYLDVEKLEKHLLKAKKRDVEALFWFSFSWSLLIINDLSDVENLLGLNNVFMIVERVIELDDGYFYGAPYALLAAYYGARTKSIGGDREKAIEMYELASKKGAGKSLIADYVMMRFVATQDQSSQAFEKYYQKIIAFDGSKSPELAYINVFLKRKARELYAKKDETFF